MFIEAGAFIRNYIDRKNLSIESQSPKDSIKDFIQGLEGIDELSPGDIARNK